MSGMLRNIVTYPVRNDENLRANYLRIRNQARRSLYLTDEDRETAGNTNPRKLVQDNSALRHDLGILQERLDMANKRLRDLAALRDDLQTCLRKSEQGRLTLEKERLDIDDHCSKMLEEIESLRHTNEQMQQEIEKLKDSLEAAAQSKLLFENSLNKLEFDRQQAITLQSSLQGALELNETLCREVTDLSLEVVNLKKENASLQRTSKEHTAETQKLKKHNDFLRTLYEKEQRDRQDTDGQARKLQGQYNETRHLLSKMRLQLGCAQDSLAAAVTTKAVPESAAGSLLDTCASQIGNLQAEMLAFERTAKYVGEQNAFAWIQLAKKDEIIEDLRNQQQNLMNTYRTNLDELNQSLVALSNNDSSTPTSGTSVNSLVKRFLDEILRTYIVREEHLMEELQMLRGVTSTVTENGSQVDSREVARQLRDSLFMLEDERSRLLTRCIVAEEQLAVYSKIREAPG
ncbi:hypothetical protein SpCBS45565_g07446 [Spizellomyces sp. 'palustris']|nr:hypothetical protein SpCBS45565_g07446 [Spizellomyces sp. 'palustris']